MSKLDISFIESTKANFPDTWIARTAKHTIIIDPALNHAAILKQVTPKEIQQKKTEIWLSSCHMQSGPYVNELAQKMNGSIYAPYSFLPHYRNFAQTAKTMNLCGVYQPKIKADLVQRLTHHFSTEFKVYMLSSSIAIQWLEKKCIWYQTLFLSNEDQDFIEKVKHELNQ
ncbi:hypothetical protein MRY82_07335 [bacterium]|nr:hypothetical protein [bacterium]